MLPSEFEAAKTPIDLRQLEVSGFVSRFSLGDIFKILDGLFRVT